MIVFLWVTVYWKWFFGGAAIVILFDFYKTLRQARKERIEEAKLKEIEEAEFKEIESKKKHKLIENKIMLKK